MLVVFLLVQQSLATFPMLGKLLGGAQTVTVTSTITDCRPTPIYITTPVYISTPVYMTAPCQMCRPAPCAKCVQSVRPPCYSCSAAITSSALPVSTDTTFPTSVPRRNNPSSSTTSSSTTTTSSSTSTTSSSTTTTSASKSTSSTSTTNEAILPSSNSEPLDLTAPISGSSFSAGHSTRVSFAFLSFLIFIN